MVSRRDEAKKKGKRLVPIVRGCTPPSRVRILDYVDIPRRKGRFICDELCAAFVRLTRSQGKVVIIMIANPVTAMVRSRCALLGNMDAEFYYAPNPVAQIPMAMFMRKGIDPGFRTGVGEQ